MAADENNWRDFRRRSRSANEEKVEAPKIHADLQKKRLLVRGRPAQIEEIKRVVASLDTAPKNQGNVRIISDFGAQSDEILELARKLWRGDNPVLVAPPNSGLRANSSERTTHPDSPTRARPTIRGDDEAARDALRGSEPTVTWSTINTQLSSIEKSSPDEDAMGPKAGENPIRIQVGPGGIIVQSDDAAALDEFEAHLRGIARLRGAAESAEPVVFYLKYATANEATRMLADLLDGARWLSSSSGGFLDGTDASSTDGSYWGSLLMSRDGTTTMTAGSATVVSDARLNRLIVQGTPDDIALIEGYLKVIDKDTSITSVETHGRSRVIELVHTSAAEVATVLREAYGERIAGAKQQAAQRNAQQRDGDKNNDEEERQGDNNEPRRPAARPPRNQEPDMTLAVHEASNSLIVTAPQQLFLEVEQLARMIDQRAEQAVEIVVPRTLNGRYVHAVLQNALLQARPQDDSGRQDKQPTEATSAGQGRDRE